LPQDEPCPRVPCFFPVEPDVIASTIWHFAKGFSAIEGEYGGSRDDYLRTRFLIAVVWR